MRLDMDCVRDILLAVEDCAFDERITLAALKSKRPDYSEEQLWYTCLKLEEAGFLNLMTVQFGTLPYPEIKQINYLTYQGHEFIEKIRDTDQWSIIKKGAIAVRNYSLSAITAIAEGVTTAAINAYLSGQAGL